MGKFHGNSMGNSMKRAFYEQKSMEIQIVLIVDLMILKIEKPNFVFYLFLF